MEKKQSKWIWKTVVAACIAASILSYTVSYTHLTLPTICSVDMENRGGCMHSRVHTELYVHTVCKGYDE